MQLDWSWVCEVTDGDFSRETKGDLNSNSRGRRTKYFCNGSSSVEFGLEALSGRRIIGGKWKIIFPSLSGVNFSLQQTEQQFWRALQFRPLKGDIQFRRIRTHTMEKSHYQWPREGMKRIIIILMKEYFCCPLSLRGGYSPWKETSCVWFWELNLAVLCFVGVVWWPLNWNDTGNGFIRISFMRPREGTTLKSISHYPHTIHGL